MKRVMIWALALFLAPWAQAATVQLNDGSSLSGEITEQANGDVVVKTGAGDVTVAKDKIRAIVKEGSAASEGDMSYVDKVLKRREKYGNEDGIPHAANIDLEQIAFTLGMINYLGDGLNFNYAGSTYVGSADFSGLHYGISYQNSFNDMSGWELFAGFSQGSKGFTISSISQSGTVSANRVDVAYLFKVQKAIALGEPESRKTFIPHIGLGPIYSYVNYAGYWVDTTTNTLKSNNVGTSAVGAMLSAGADLQLGSALIGAKVRYVFSNALGNGLSSNNLSALIPQLSIGFAF